MNNLSTSSVLKKIGTIAGIPMMLFAFIIVYGEAKNIAITLIILLPLVVVWTNFLMSWRQESDEDTSVTDDAAN